MLPGAAAAGGQTPFPTPRPRLPRNLIDLKPTLFPIRTIWTLDLGFALAAPPAFFERTGYFALDDGRLAAYDLQFGEQIWITSIETMSRPAPSPDFLFVAQDDAIVALRTLDASIAWTLPFAEPLAAPLVWDNGWLVAATHDGSVLAYRGTDGQLIWRADLGSPAHAEPALAGDRVYVPTEDGRVVSLRVDTGAVVWEQRLGGAAGEVLALDKHVYVGSRDNSFYRLAAKDGEREKVWRTGGDVFGMPVVDEHNVFFVSLDNVLRSLSRRSGNQQWKRAMSLRPFAGPVRAADVLIVPGFSTALPAFSLTTGAPIGNLTAGGEVVAPPHVADIPGLGATVFLVTADIAKGATVTAVARRVDPVVDTLTALPAPNPISVPPPAEETLPAPFEELPGAIVFEPPWPSRFEALPGAIAIPPLSEVKPTSAFDSM